MEVRKSYMSIFVAFAVSHMVQFLCLGFTTFFLRGYERPEVVVAGFAVCYVVSTIVFARFLRS